MSARAVRISVRVNDNLVVVVDVDVLLIGGGRRLVLLQRLADGCNRVILWTIDEAQHQIVLSFRSSGRIRHIVHLESSSNKSKTDWFCRPI
jgi:phosphoribosylformimino-5-aminoimidazole carboxamide ribonucleotide (ProFAR) isomerase